MCVCDMIWSDIWYDMIYNTIYDVCCNTSYEAKARVKENLRNLKYKHKFNGLSVKIIWQKRM